MKEYDIICIGTALIDSIIRGFDPNPVSVTGFCAKSGSLNIGGEAVNVSIAAAKLGMRTGILCSLGNDSAGDMIVSALQRCGVDTNLIIRSEEHPTPVTTMFVNEDGSRKSITNESHRYNFHPEKHAESFMNAKALILGSLFRAPFDDPEIIQSILTLAKKAGETVFADTKLPNFSFLKTEDLKYALPFIDYITPNEDEAKYYTGKENPEEMADVFLGYGVRNVIIKLGARGCFFKNSEKKMSIPACDITAIDATGAGDNLIAGFASEILRGATVEEALIFGNACGAICATGIGASTALKNREQVADLINGQ
ncbi:MAG: carbohydrate kinase family protein [Lachnospiraceae bacterium]|nr:carbohydrate kinase family protein [Lachnospiraceae bacterium]